MNNFLHIHENVVPLPSIFSDLIDLVQQKTKKVPFVRQLQDYLGFILSIWPLACYLECVNVRFTVSFMIKKEPFKLYLKLLVRVPVSVP